MLKVCLSSVTHCGICIELANVNVVARQSTMVQGRLKKPQPRGQHRV